MNKNGGVGLLLFLFAVLFLTACTEAGLIYRMGKNDRVHVYPLCDGFTLPRLRYYFYYADESFAPILSGCDGAGNYVGSLPPAVYQVLAVNASVTSVSFDDMGGYSTAMAVVRSYTSRSGDVWLAQADSIYAVPIPELVSEDRKELTYTPDPVLLTKCIRFRFELSDGLDARVKTINGTLSEVYPSVFLSTGSVTGMGFATGAMQFSLSGSSGSIDVLLFGLRDPRYGSAYRYLLPLSLTYVDGGTPEHTQVDITDVLSDAFTSGVLAPLTRISIRLRSAAIGVEAEVLPWDDSGTGEGTVN